MSSLDNLPEFLKPTIKMFLSVDLIGSTKLKHDEDVLGEVIDNGGSLDTVGANWFNALIDFYGGFEEKFRASWKRALTDDRIVKGTWPKDEIPNLWKINGDELIFVFDIKHPEQIVVALYAWREALLKYRKHLQIKKANVDVKATAWMAGFPIGNHEVAFWGDLSNVNSSMEDHSSKFGQYYRLNRWYEDQSSDKKSEFVKDYIGPAVDTGFRISKFASSRRFPISIEIAYFLSKSSVDAEVLEDIAIYYHGRESLKGVLGGAPYPIFWIDTASPEDELTQAEDELVVTPKTIKITKIKKFVSLFFEDEKNKLFRPFIYGYEGASLSKMPNMYELKLCQTADVWKAELEKMEIVSTPNAKENGEEVTEEQLNDFEKFLASIAPKPLPSE